MSGDPVPAIAEAAASGETAVLFADLRATLGVPVVNLIWRHLATMPGALPWVWGAVKPLYTSGAVVAAAEAFRSRMTLPSVPALPVAALSAAGLGAADRAGIDGVLASYDHSNTINLLAMTTFLRQPQGVSRDAPPATGAPPMPEALPKLLTFAEMAEPTADLVRALNLLGERDEGRIVASMWRHLAHWPPFLSLAWVLLAPLEATDALRPAIAANLALAERLQADLAPRLGRSEPPAAATGDTARAAVRTFVDHPIGKMVTLCRILKQAVPPPTAR